ncbi:MAG: hypothetical protein HYV46_01660 [candidate division NC10 bacterium]|nr:hypothetical protein [candidate division NC10 bacterium]
MIARRILGPLLPFLLAMALLGGGSVGAQQPQGAPARVLLESFARKTLAGEVMSVDLDKRTLVIRTIEKGDQERDISIVLDDRTVLKKLRTPISGGDLSPGHLVKVTYREHTGRLVARRIEVTGKAVHPPMP